MCWLTVARFDINGAMRRALVLLALFALLAPAAAEPVRRPPAREHRAKVMRPAPNPCAEFGPGFMRAPGSDTCIMFGGGIGIGVGAGSAGAGLRR